MMLPFPCLDRDMEENGNKLGSSSSGAADKLKKPPPGVFVFPSGILAIGGVAGVAFPKRNDMMYRTRGIKGVEQQR